MINYVIEYGINWYNFYGISGDFSEDVEDVGVVKFKKGYDVDVIEYVGDFIKFINKLMYNIYRIFKKLKK